MRIFVLAVAAGADTADTAEDADRPESVQMERSMDVSSLRLQRYVY